MSLAVTETEVKNVLTRTSGYLHGVTSHSLQPYRGCSFGNALCGVGCYVQHNGHLLKGRRWGSFLEVRTNAADSYREHYARESRWAVRNRERFSVFCSSATDPFVPQESRYRVTRSVLEAMIDAPPDELILQTHSHRVTDYLELYCRLADCCKLRIHLSIETDRPSLPGLPPHASSVERRFTACAALKQAGLQPVVTVSPLLPIDNPERFFATLADVADAVVIDHFIEGDGSADGGRTRRTPLPAAMEAVCPESVTLTYREQMIEIARQHLPGRVGVSAEGFAGCYT